MIMKNVPQNEKLTLFLDYSVGQWMQNENVPIEMWNVNKRRRRTNNGVAGWNSKRHRIVGKQRPNVFHVQKLKEEAEFMSCQLRPKELGHPGQKQEKCLDRITEQYYKYEMICTNVAVRSAV